jgi:hypothetical protein
MIPHWRFSLIISLVRFYTVLPVPLLALREIAANGPKNTRYESRQAYAHRFRLTHSSSHTDKTD